MKRGNGLTKVVVFGLALVLAGGILLGACARPAPAPAGAGEPIVVARIDLYTGAAAPYAELGRKALEMYADEINQAGGVLGRPLKFLYRDVSNPEETVRAAKDFVTLNKVNFIHGIYSSSCALALSKFAKENKIIFLAAMGKSSKLSEEYGHPYIFCINQMSIYEGRVMGQIIADHKLPCSRIHTIASDYEYGHAVTDEFVGQLKKVKPEAKILGQAWPPFMCKEYAPYVTTVLGAQPDLVVSTLWGTDWINFVKAANPFGFFQKVPIVANMGGEWEDNLALGKEAPQGILASNDGAPYDEAVPGVKEYVAKFKARYGAAPGLGAFCELPAIYLLVAAIKKAGTTDTEAVRNALEGLQADTNWGPLYIRPCDRLACRGVVWGKTKWSDEWKNTILVDQVFYKPDPYLPSCEEVLAKRVKDW